jgi:hypothetical protein
VRLVRSNYQCGACGHDYELPGADLSFQYGAFLGVSRNLEAVVFEAVTYPGFAELWSIINSLADDLPDHAPEQPPLVLPSPPADTHALQAAFESFLSAYVIERPSVVTGTALREAPATVTAMALSVVADPDSRGDRYVFTGTPGCPACGSTSVADFSDTEEPWPRSADPASHREWDGLAYEEKVLRVRAALGLDPLPRHEG